MAGMSESETLRPLSREARLDRDGNDWPCYAIHNTIVTDDAGNITSLFDASLRLLIVSGELQFDKELKHNFLLPSKRKSVLIEVKSVGRYSFGSCDDGSVVIWAAGQSGWFEISPAPQYQEVFNEMVLATKAWYHLLDNHKLHTALSKNVRAAFAESHKMASVDKLYNRYASFLVQSMNDDNKDKWVSTPIYQYLKTEMTKQPVVGSVGEIPVTTRETARQRQLKKRDKKVSADGHTKRKKEPEHDDIVHAVAELRRLEMEASIMWKFIKKIGEKQISPKDLTISRLVQELRKGFIFESPRQAELYILLQKLHLVRYMQDRRQRRDWIDSPLYISLMVDTMSQQIQNKMSQFHLQARDFQLDHTIQDLEQYSSSEEEIPTHPTISTLRPRSAFKGKGKSMHSGKGKEPIRSGIDTDEPTSSPDSVMVRKRKAMDDDEIYPSSMACLFPPSCASEPRTGGMIETIEQKDSAPLTIRWKSEPCLLALDAISIQKGPALSALPNGSGDAWCCTAPGCMQSVYGASTDLGRRLIDDHIEEHHYQTDPADEEDGAKDIGVDIALREMKKTNLPVTNLVRKIREFNAATSLLQAMAGATNTDLTRPTQIRRLVK